MGRMIIEDITCFGGLGGGHQIFYGFGAQKQRFPLDNTKQIFAPAAGPKVYNGVRFDV